MYVKNSEHVGLDTINGSFDVNLQFGLFSKVVYRKNDDIVFFVGEEIDYEEMLSRSLAGKQGYFVQCTKNLYIDCFENRKNGICFASCANSVHVAHPIMHKQSGVKGKTNIRLEVFYVFPPGEPTNKQYYAKYVALTNICAKSELLGHYKP